MQVSSIDTAPPQGSEQETAKPATAASDAFAILLQNSLEPRINPGLLKFADAGSLAQQLSASRDTFAEARRAEDTRIEDPVEFDDEDIAPVSDDTNEDTAPVSDDTNEVTGKAQEDEATDSVKQEDALLFLANSRIAPDSRLSSNGAAAVAAEGQSRVAAQQPATSRPVAPETVAVAPAITSNDATAKTGNSAASKNGGADGRIPATVTESRQQFVSRPANTLAAAATLTAQTGNTLAAQPGKANGPTDGALGNSAPGTSSATGNLLLSDSGGRTMYQGSGQRGAARTSPTVTGNTGNTANTADVATNANTASASFAASLAANRPSPPQASVNSIPGADRAAGALPPAQAALGGQAPATASAARPTVPPPPRPASPPGALREQIAVQVQKAVAQGVDRINIQLKPAELGRLEIRLEIAQDGRVSALVTVERPETLELLQKDSRGLQQALQDAGLKTDSSGLSFNLRGGDTAPQEQAADSGGAAGQKDADTTNGDELAENQDESTHRRASDSLIDVEV